MKKIVFALCLIALLLPGLCLASGEGAATLYNQGNALYAKGDYSGALKSYQYALDQRVADPRLEQNIGSAYLKLGRIGPAIYHFERGLLLDPRNDDLRHNLEYAKALRKDEIPSAGGQFLSDLFGKIVGEFTLGEWIAIFSVFFTFTFLTALLFLLIQGRARPPLMWILAASVALLFLVTPFTGSRLYRDRMENRAVIVADQVIARTGPGEKLKEAFIVHGGMPCKVVEQRNGWRRVGIATGIIGWVPADAAKIIGFEQTTSKDQ